MAAILFLTFFGILVWELRKKEERQKMVAEMRERPLYALFVFTWFGFICVFFFGVMAPVLGEIEVGDTGLELWQIGGIGTFGMWIITWFVKID